MKSIYLFVLLSLFSCVTNATRVIDNIHNNILIEPNKPFITTIQSIDNIRIGWETITLDCKTNCIEARNISDRKITPIIGAQFGATLEYKPVNGKVIIEYKNISDKPVAINVFTEHAICDSMACQYLKAKGISDLHNYNEVQSDWKRIVIKTIFSFQTSKDGSYSIVTGESIFGTKYEISIVWWLIDEQRPSFCKKWIPEYGTYSPEKEKAYQFNGSYTKLPVKGIMYGVSCSFMAVKERDNNDI